MLPFLLLILALSLHPLTGQEPGKTEENSSTVYIIREVAFDINGFTKPFALITHGEFREGEQINGKENLDKYLALKRQLLLNQQVLEDVRIEYSLGKSEEDGALPVRLLLHVKDSWNIIILPYPKYDSNDGFSITLKARDYNFLGTMSALRVDLGYSQEDDERSLDFSIESDVPFHAGGFNWIFNFDHFFSYTFDETLFYQNVTGLAMLLPWRLTSFTFGFNQYLTINEENTEANREIFDLGDRFYGPYGTSELYVSWRIPFGIEVAGFGELAYTPGVSAKINYPYGKMDDPRKPVSTLSHSLGFGRINWIGNYRKGLSASIGNAYSWYFDRPDAPLRITLDADAKYHWSFSEYFGVSSRLRYRHFWHMSDHLNDHIPYYHGADIIRGVLNDEIRINYMLSLNLDLPFRILRFWPSDWFNNQKLQIFNFEMHLSPFTDMALVHGPYSKLKSKRDPMSEETSFNLKDMLNTAGLEVIIFPDFFRSLKFRASIGYNIKKLKDEGVSLRWGFFPDWDEIFIGLDHSY